MSLALASPNVCRTLVLALVLGPAALAHAQFRVAQTLPVPGMTRTVAVAGDFNADGLVDLVLVLENTTSALVQGHAWIWSEPGQLIANVPFSLSAKQSLRLDLATVVPGRKGAITVSHDGPYGSIVGKGVAIEPATGFTFDTLLRVRPR